MSITKKEKAKMERNLQSYREYAKKNDCYCPPTKGINSGSQGRLFELETKRYLNNRYKKISAASQIDTRKFGYTFEIKSGCGELARVEKDGTIRSVCFKKDYVIYCPQYIETLPIEEQSFVLTGKDFYQLLEELGLIRTKKSSAWQDDEYASEAYRKGDRLAIQSFRNSAKKENALYNALSDYPTLKEFVEEMKKGD